MKALLLSVTPMIPSGPNLAEALRFFTEHLGFSTLWQTEATAGIQRDTLAFNLVQNNVRAWADNASFSIAVSDLDSLYAEYSAFPSTLGPLEVKPWGRREFHMILPSGVCLQFYQQDASSE